MNRECLEISMKIQFRKENKSEKYYFSLGKFVSALRHKRCIMRKGQRRNEDSDERFIGKRYLFIITAEKISDSTVSVIHCVEF